MKTFLAGVLAFIAGSFAMIFVWIFLLAVVAGAMGDSVVKIADKSILRIDLSETITDAPSTDPLAGVDLMTMQTQRRLSIYQVLRALEAAADDDRIEGIYLRLNGSGGIEGTALMEELREGLERFRLSGKFVVAYNEAYSQGQYYLASVADAVYLQPEGGIDWSGLAFNTMFYKGLLDKLNVRAEVFRPTACRYKSAVEPYILDRMSDGNRRQMQQLVDSMWETISSAVAAARGIDPAQLKAWTDRLEVSLPEEALEAGFVDGLLYEDQMDDVFAELGVEADANGDYAFVSLGDYAAQVVGSLDFAAPQVAIVYAEGQIVDGEGVGRQIFGNTLAAKLREVRDDDQVKAVVLRVNSPGGSALASDVVWREMELLRAEKPVVVSMGSYAASGGYYISCPADVIMADRLTLTGSIGVFGMYLDTVDALKSKLGITIDGVKSNTSAGMGVAAPLTPLERKSIMRGVDKVYETFTALVAEGRNLPLERVLEIAGGRVWSGSDALGVGLADGIGGLTAAIAAAVEKASLGEDYRVVERLDRPTGFAAFLSSLNARVRAGLRAEQPAELVREWAELQQALGQQGVRAYSPYRVELR